MAATSVFHFREHWREIKQGKPGHRFQARYERARRHEHQAGAGQRIFFLGVGLVSLVIGLLLVVFPGPAIPFLFLAGASLASESRHIAKVMDWAEVRVRKTAAWLREKWRPLPAPVRVALIMIGACCSAASAYFTFRLMHG